MIWWLRRTEKPDFEEFKVRHPPQSHSGATTLLLEHYIFAPHGYDQDGWEAVVKEAAKLRVSKNRIFWWD
jgi:hypothetical protein